MTEPVTGRPGSSTAGYHASSVPSSPRPSIASRASRSSLRREQERQDLPVHPRPSSVAYPSSQSQSPQPPPALDDPAQSSSPPLNPPSFGPLFALVTSTTHPSHRLVTRHPSLHYIFADDDPELLTAALAQHHRGDEELVGDDAELNHPRDRAVVLDMVPTADGNDFEIAWASSLSTDWAVVSTRVSRVGGVDGALAAAHGDGHGALMLTIEGVSVEPSSAPASSGKTATPEAEMQSSGASGPRPAQPQHAQEYVGLLSDFEKRMGVLRGVVEAGGERQRRMVTEGNTFGQTQEQHPLG